MTRTDRSLTRVVMAVVLLATIQTVLGGAFDDGRAAEGEPIDADCPSGECVYLTHYAELICLRAAYARLSPEPTAVLEALDREAWGFVERTRAGPDTYHAIHTLATAHGSTVSGARAVEFCRSWAEESAELRDMLPE